MKRSFTIAAMALALAGAATRADAGMISFTTLGAWSAAVGSFGTETFNGFATDTTFHWRRPGVGSHNHDWRVQ